MMLGPLGTLAFLNPWVLAGLIFLPALWFLLRVTPPAPRLIVFPAARFVADLIAEEPTTSKTPWWILLLRIITLALILVALAQPVLNPSSRLPGSGPVRIVIDNGWAAAQTWSAQIERAQDIVTSAGRERREIHLMTTAPDPGSESPSYQGPLGQGQAESLLRGMKPQPWAADYKAALKPLQEQDAKTATDTYWLSHGLKDGDAAPLMDALKKQGSLSVIMPEDSQLPLLLRPARKITQALSVMVSGPKTLPAGTPVSVNALGRDGRVLDSQRLTLDLSEKSAEVTFDIPDAIRNQVTQVRLSGRKGAGAVLLLDDQYKRRDIGIAAPAGDPENAPLIEETFYIARALEPYANVTFDPVQDLLKEKPSVIVLANVGAMPPADLNALENWVREGGLLLRFAGPNMTQGESFLVPVPLMKGGRALDGSLTWDQPVKLAPFPESSPLYGLEIPEDVVVRRQMLAEPVEGLDRKTWASLEDGTPLITADNLGNGLIVFVHTTATPQWSDLSLSGLFVQMLRRVINLAGTGKQQTDAQGTLQPLLLLDGMGGTVQPGSYVRPVPSGAFDDLVPGPFNPPGLYGRAGYQVSMNIGDRINSVLPLSGIPMGVATATYGGASETDLMPWILLAAFALFLIDWCLMAAMQANWSKLRFLPRGAAAAMVLFCFGASPAIAQNQQTYADELYLAYIRTGNIAVDTETQQGLDALAEVLKDRTSVEPAGTVALNPEKDELAFFPLIYWPIADEQKPLSSKALQNIQYYLNHGGTVLIDTRDALSTVKASASYGGRNAEKLRTLLGGLNVPPLVPAPKDHVLTKSFYLLDNFPGRFENGTLWVEEQSATGNDGVSSVIIGSNDWASGWASAGGSGSRLSGGPQQQEMAMRFGVNLVMYALTGNYKADQVHLPHILERLGQ